MRSPSYTRAGTALAGLLALASVVGVRTRSGTDG